MADLARVEPEAANLFDGLPVIRLIDRVGKEKLRLAEETCQASDLAVGRTATRRLFNRHHGRAGHLFQGRSKAFLGARYT